MRSPRNCARSASNDGRSAIFVEICGGDEFLLHHADLDLELLLIVEELLQDLRDASGILSANDHRRRARSSADSNSGSPSALAATRSELFLTT